MSGALPSGWVRPPTPSALALALAPRIPDTFRAKVTREQGMDEVGAADTGTGAIAPSEGVWDLDVFVNPQTAITCVDLPHFSREKPLQGTKPARVRAANTARALRFVALTANALSTGFDAQAVDGHVGRRQPAHMLMRAS
jgi:hypothetical protein